MGHPRAVRAVTVAAALLAASATPALAQVCMGGIPGGDAEFHVFGGAPGSATRAGMGAGFDLNGRVAVVGDFTYAENPLLRPAEEFLFALRVPVQFHVRSIAVCPIAGLLYGEGNGMPNLDRVGVPLGFAAGRELQLRGPLSVTPYLRGQLDVSWRGYKEEIPGQGRSWQPDHRRELALGAALRVGPIRLRAEYGSRRDGLDESGLTFALAFNRSKH